MSTPDLARMVRELTEPSKQRVRRPDGTTEWLVSAPSLLNQLSSLEPSSAEGARRAFGSRPAASIEALDAAAAIDRESAALVRAMGHDDDGDAAAMIRRLHGLHASADGHWRSEIEHYVRSWYCQARVVSGWDSAPRRLYNRCPNCSQLGGLRVNVADKYACCVECRAAWDSATIGLLAEAVRHENNDTAA